MYTVMFAIDCKFKKNDNDDDKISTTKIFRLNTSFISVTQCSIPFNIGHSIKRISLMPFILSFTVPLCLDFLITACYLFLQLIHPVSNAVLKPKFSISLFVIVSIFSTHP